MDSAYLVLYVELFHFWVGYVSPKHMLNHVSNGYVSMDIYYFLPVKISLGSQLGTRCRSSRGVRTPSRFPNMEDRPRLKSMRKKSTAHTCEPGMLITASVNTMKARPVPDALWVVHTQERSSLMGQRKHEHMHVHAHIRIDMLTHTVSPNIPLTHIQKCAVPHMYILQITYYR